MPKFLNLSDVDKEDSLEYYLIKEMRQNKLEEFFSTLSAEDRMLLFMKYTDGLSIDHISSVTKLNNSAIKMRLMRARKKCSNR